MNGVPRIPPLVSKTTRRVGGDRRRVELGVVDEQDREVAVGERRRAELDQLARRARRSAAGDT